nr:MAG TPA: hypothetical protein [Caudoviricetes sp.]
MKLFLDENLVGEALTAEGTLTYVALKKIMDENIFLKSLKNTEDYISVNRMAYTLVGDCKYPDKLMKALNSGLYELELENKIRIVRNFNKTEYIIDMKNLYLDTSKDNQHFVMVSSDEVNKILNSDVKMEKKIRMLKYYLVLIGSFDWSTDMKCKANMPNLQGKIGHMTQSYLGGRARVDERTCQRYNKILDDEWKMIYIYGSNDKIKEDDSLRQITNCYSRYEDKDLCEMYASDFENKMGYKHRIVRTKKNKEQADNNRRLAQIYNRICEGYGDSYDEDTIRKVYKYVTNKNKTVIDEIDKKQSQEYMSSSDKDYVKNLQSQIRDTLIFGQFAYLNEDSQDGNSDEDVWGEIDAIENGYTVEEILEMPTASDVVA